MREESVRGREREGEGGRDGGGGRGAKGHDRGNAL